MYRFWEDPKFWGLVVSTGVAIGSTWIGLLVPAPYTEVAQTTLMAVGTIVAAMFGVGMSAQRLEARIVTRLSGESKF